MASAPRPLTTSTQCVLRLGKQISYETTNRKIFTADTAMLPTGRLTVYSHSTNVLEIGEKTGHIQGWPLSASP
jgi:hypothetical protein